MKITETVLRDGQQSLMATRMKKEDIVPILEKMDSVGYYSIECWGGATFDVCLKYLSEDPWERLRLIKRHLKKTKLQMLLRGQNLLGYRNYADDVVDTFIAKAVENGIDIIRIFDGLNDPRNLAQAVKSAKREGAHVQAAIAYTTGEPYTLDYWRSLVKEYDELGPDSICIKDMAGLLTPASVQQLISSIREQTKLPIHIHSHCTSGMAPITYLKAIESGCDGIDTAISPFSMGTSQPPTEVMYGILKELGYDACLDENLLSQVAAYFAEIRKKAEREGVIDIDAMHVNWEALKYQIPGGMLTNLYMQLGECNAKDRFDEVIEEIPRVRKDFGYPPLVTPMSQIVCTQAVYNVLMKRRYGMVSNQAKALLKGEYGKTIVPFDDEIRGKIVGDHQTLTCRPADMLSPEMETQSNVKNINEKGIEAALAHIMLPASAEKFWERKIG